MELTLLGPFSASQWPTKRMPAFPCTQPLSILTCSAMQDNLFLSMNAQHKRISPLLGGLCTSGHALLSPEEPHYHAEVVAPSSLLKMFSASHLR